jgi:hypothetical protein
VEIKRTQRNLGAVPMDLSAFTKGKGKGDPSKTCNNCGKPGHFAANCWNTKSGGKAKKGDSKGKGSKNQQSQPQPSKFDGECNYCKKKGRKSKDCRKKAADGKSGRPLNAIEDKKEISVDGIFLNAVELNSLRIPAQEGTKVSIGVDTCAGVTVWPEDLLPIVPTVPTPESIAGYTYSSAGKDSEPIRDLGQRQYHLSVDGMSKNIKVRVARVRRPLLAVSEMTRAGHDVRFLASDQAYAVRKETGEMTKFHLRRGVYELDVEVRPSSVN